MIGTDSPPVAPFHTYLWKIATRCNINCSYCYVYNLVDARWKEQPSFMSEAVARQTAKRIREHGENHGKDHVVIIFHGGEPLLGGVPHLRTLVSVIKEELSGFQVDLGMQSNGLLFSEEIGDFLMANGVAIGISIDGPPAVNDLFRVDHKGRPTSAELENRLSLLLTRYRNIFAGFLCVVNSHTDPISVTRYLLSYNPSSIDFILPYHNYDSRPKGKEDDLMASPYGDWLISSFDYWFRGRSRTPIRMFNSIIRLLFGAPSQVESLGLEVVDLVVVEANGDVEAVDSLKSAYDGATKLGYNVFRDDFDQVASDWAVKQRQIGASALCEKCRDCEVVAVCGGGYIPNRYSSERAFDNPSVYCSDLERLIRHIHSAVSVELSAVKENLGIGMERH